MIPVTGILNANDHEGIRASVGKVVAVTGKVQNIGRTRSGSIQFINFAGNEKGQFVGIVKKENLEAVVTFLGVELKPALTGRMIELRGEIVLYQDTPEIIVSSPNQVRVIEE